MTSTRVCIQCKAILPENDTRCSQCGHEANSKRETRTCTAHEIRYDVWVSAAGEHLSGFCPLCMEQEDRVLDKELHSFNEQLNELTKKREHLRILKESPPFGIQSMAAIFFLSPILALTGAGILFWAMRSFFLVTFLILFAVLDIIFISIPLLRRAVALKQFDETQARIDELETGKRKAIQRNVGELAGK
ncbi:MAG: hypothetical protein C4527_11815 [Candidatus Omnitrophota bacterium]|jgi:ribosomal protein L40E|nr:MAG: hypothetical protein C4527_11815 [Candidatus Omnitrophota bacterium]